MLTHSLVPRNWILARLSQAQQRHCAIDILCLFICWFFFDDLCGGVADAEIRKELFIILMCGWIRHGTLVIEGVQSTLCIIHHSLCMQTQPIKKMIIKHFRSSAHNFLIREIKIAAEEELFRFAFDSLRFLLMHKDAIILLCRCSAISHFTKFHVRIKL